MSAVLVDSNVLLDLMTKDPFWQMRSSEALAKAADGARLVINPIVYAEVSVHYSQIDALEAALPTSMLERENLPYEAAFLAGKAFLSYRRRGGAKQSPMPDFFIGAHAAFARYRIMTRDERHYRTYFPDVSLIVP